MAFPGPHSRGGGGLLCHGHGSARTRLGDPPRARAPAPAPCLTAGFPQLYHACHGPGLSVLCFMRQDVLEYFSVYGTALSMWVSLMGEWSPRAAHPADGPGSLRPTPALSWVRSPVPVFTSF